MNGYLFYIKNILNIFTNRIFIGWGRKRTGQFACFLSVKFKGKFKLLEDGFIRSVGLGVEGAKLFSVVEDDFGIYYDATQPSQLEHILDTSEFSTKIICEARWCIDFIISNHICKYNNAPDITTAQVQKYELQNNS
ncbi:MAG: capsular polysaccharide biosynthesis protein, partial [Campylobacter sp.]|nr:capsular polysaccharide biosynthesis protein [Campylobacter sp.]